MKFDKFEKINLVLEYYAPDQLDNSILESFGLSESDIPTVESFNEGILSNIKNAISKALPGGTINKAEIILNKYANSKKTMLKEIGSLEKTAFKAKTNAEKNKDNKNLANVASEMEERNKKSIKVIQDAANKKIDAIQDELNEFMKDKPERVKTYIRMRIAEIQQISAELEIKDAQEYASEDRLKELEKIIYTRDKLTQKYLDKIKGKNTSDIDKQIDKAKKAVSDAESNEDKLKNAA